jgi:hypothetical protein
VLEDEQKVGFEEDILLDQGIKEIASDERPFEIVNAFEMLNNKRR